MRNQNISEETISEFIPAVEKVDSVATLDDKFRLSLAIGLFVEKIVSMESAAKLAHLSLSNFVQILNNKKIYWSEYTEEHFDQDNSAIKKYFNLKRQAD